MKKIITQVFLSSFFWATAFVPVHAMEGIPANYNESSNILSKAISKDSGSSTSLIPVLINNNPHIFALRNVESVKALLDYQSRKYVEHLLLYLQPQMTQETQAIFDEFMQRPQELGLDFLRNNLALKNKVAYFIALQFLRCAMLTEKELKKGDEKTFQDTLMNFIEFRNIALTRTELHTFLSSASHSPMKLSSPEITGLVTLFEEDINDYSELQAKFKTAHQVIYPFTRNIEKIEEPDLDKIIEIMARSKDEREVEVALCLFGNITREFKGYEAKLDVEVTLFGDLFTRYQNSPLIMQNMSFCLRNQMIFCSPQKLESYTSLINDLISNPDEVVAQWASRAYGARLERRLEFDAPISLENFYPLLSNQYESIASWALNWGGHFLSSDKIKPVHAIDGLGLYNNILSVLRMQGERAIKSPEIILAALGSLGNIVLKQEISDKGPGVIPEEIVRYMDLEMLKIFPEDGEKIFLFACRCVANISSSGGVNKIALSSDILQRVVSSIDSGNEKIAVWSICFLGTLSGNAFEYNKKIRLEVGSKDILKKLVDCLDRPQEKDAKILEAALWSIHRIAWCEEHVNTLRVLGCTFARLAGFLSHPSNKVQEGACLCLGVLASEGDIESFIPLIMPSLESVARNQNSQLRLIAVRSLNTLVTSTNKGCNNNRKIIGQHENLIKLLVDLLDSDEPLLLESLCWCLGNLSFNEENSTYLCPLVLHKLTRLLDRHSSLYKTPSEREKVVEGACFCLCNLLVESDVNDQKMSNDYGNATQFFINLLKKNAAETDKGSQKILETALWAIHKIGCGKDAMVVDDYYSVFNNAYKRTIKYNLTFDTAVSLLEHSNNKIVAGACWCLGKMIPWHYWESNTLGTGQVLLKLLERFLNLDEKLVILTLRCLGTICVQDECSDAQKRQIGAAGLPTLLRILQSNSDNLALRETCCWCIASLLPFEENIQYFNQHNGLMALRSLFNKTSNDKIKEALLFMYSTILKDKDMMAQITDGDVKFIIETKEYALAKISKISAEQNSGIQNNLDSVIQNIVESAFSGAVSCRKIQTPARLHQPNEASEQFMKIVQSAEQCLKLLAHAGKYKADN